MPRDPLVTSSVRAGVTIQEVIDIATDNIGAEWTENGCTDFVWGVTNLAGAPFFDLNDKTTGGDPTVPQDVAYVVPHSPGLFSGTDNIGGDGWEPIPTGPSVSALRAALQPGDVVRVYAAGNTTETSDGLLAHSFIVVSVDGGDIQVVDNWGRDEIFQHSLDDITDGFAPGGTFQSAFISRLDEDFAASTFGTDIEGNGFGDFTGIGDAAPTEADLRWFDPSSIDSDTVTAGDSVTIDFGYAWHIRPDDDVSLPPDFADFINIYLSDDTTVSADDLLLDTIDNRGIGQLFPAVSLIYEYLLADQTVTIPSSVTTGEYNMLLEIDPLNKVNETNESNNSFAIPISVTGAPEPEKTMQIIHAQGSYDSNNYGDLAFGVIGPAFIGAGGFSNTLRITEASDSFTLINADDLSRTTVISGTGFTYDDFGPLTGTISQVDFYDNGLLLASLRDLELDAAFADQTTDTVTDATIAQTLALVFRDYDIVYDATGANGAVSLPTLAIAGPIAVNGSAFDDTLAGSLGNDNFIGGGAYDTYVLEGNWGQDTIYDADPLGQVSFIGYSEDDVIFSTDGADLLATAGSNQVRLVDYVNNGGDYDFTYSEGTSTETTAPVDPNLVYLTTNTGGLYTWNPATNTTDFIGATTITGAAIALTDIAVGPDGTLYGIDGGYLFRVDAQTAEVIAVGALAGDLFFGTSELTNAAGFDIGPDGVGRISSADNVIVAVVDLETGAVANPHGPSLGFATGGGDIWITESGDYFASTGSSNLLTISETLSGSEYIADNDFIAGANLGGLVSLAGPGEDERAQLVGFLGNRAYTLSEGDFVIPGLEFATLPVAGDITGAARMKSTAEPNQAPSLNFPTSVAQGLSVPENTSFIIGLNPSDDRDSEGDGLTYTITGPSAEVVTIDQSNGNLSFVEPPDFENPFPSLVFTGSAYGYAFTVTVTDSGGLSDSSDFLVRATNVDDEPTGEAPVLNLDPEITVAVGTSLIADIDATDDEDSEGSGLTYTISGGDDAVFFNIDATTGQLTYFFGGIAPASDTNGDGLYEIDVTVTDSEGLSDTNLLSIRALPLEHASTEELEYFSRISAYGNGDVGQLNDMGTIAGLSLGWQVTQEWEIGQFRAIALEKDGVHPVLAVRGTTGALDWMENFDSGGVGFGEAEDAWNDTDLRDWLKANPTASLTGHSQGGAIAQILVEFMLDEATPMQGDVVTFNPAGINVGDDARDYSDLNEVLHFVSYGDIVSQVGDRFTPGEVHLYDFNAVGLFAPALLYTAHTEHWAQDALYDLAPFAETSEANWRGDAEDFTWLDDTRETTRLGGVTDTDTLGSGFYSNRSFRIGGDSEFLQFEAWIASLSPILSIPFVGLLTNRFTLESGRSLLGPLKEAVDTASDADSSSVDWLEENADTLVTSAALTDATAVAEVADDPAAIYHVRSTGSSLDIPTAQAAMTVASADTVDGLSVSGFDPTSSLLILDTTISAENASILRGSAIIHFDYDLDGETDATVTLEGDFNLGNFTFEDVGIGTEIRYTGNATPEAAPDTAVTSESAAITIGDLLDNDSDDDGDALAISSIDTAGTLGMVTLNGDGTVLYDPNGAFDGLLDGETATDTFTYIVSDGVETSTGTVTVTITGEGPTVTPLNLITGTAGSNFLIGTDGQDALIGLGGSYDKLLGGDGADSFVFLAETDNGRRERDVIIDYEVGIDRIVLGTDTSIAAIRQTSTQVVVSLDGDRDAIYVRGEGVTADNLTIEFSDEFQFI